MRFRGADGISASFLLSASPGSSTASKAASVSRSPVPLKSDQGVSLSDAQLGLSSSIYRADGVTVCRFFAGAGIGGEYAAVNPASTNSSGATARLRGRVDLAISGTFWIGIVIGSLISGAFLSDRLFPLALGWHLASAADRASCCSWVMGSDPLPCQLPRSAGHLGVSLRKAALSNRSCAR
jgi:MFS family permease